MPRVQRVGNNVATDIGSAPGANSSRIFDLTSPAGWTLVWWFLSIAIIALIYFSL